jgi:predicted MFS family arabinose efflux permease
MPDGPASGASRTLVERVLGASIERPLVPVLLVAVAGALSSSLTYSFIGIWALEVGGASEVQLGAAFLAAAIVGALSAYAGGAASDHVGRKPVILVGWLGVIVGTGCMIAIQDDFALGAVAFVGLSAFGSLIGAADQAMVSDVVAPEGRERAFAAQRVANNLGVATGASLGGLLLALGSWDALFGGGVLLGIISFGLAVRYLPRRGAHAPESKPERGSFGVIRRDGLFLLLLVSSCFSWIVYIAYETLLPVSLTQSHGVSESTWGLLLAINPVTVTLLQLRVTTRTERYPDVVKLPLAIAIMGGSFLLLPLNAGIPVIVVVIAIFVFGEMLWVPASQNAVTRLAPDDLRGAYLGAFRSAPAVGFALCPFFGFQVRAAAGDTAMWVMIAAIGAIGAAISVVALRGSRTSAPPVASVR